ncbi:MAG: helix-turn-helix transcriptional regulator [Pseudomonadota bacterium]|nr:helix-turn-helix transcriptional regulator [Pseudomonadota bacterium]DAM28115.1 MAG TPA: helix-turn-helix domain protein [Caudoviricetes sp.]
MTTAKNSSRRRFDADLVVGARLRLMRNLLGRSQADVAAALGLTFQQLQKYEKAGNRISAGRLQQLAVEYDCPVAWFFGAFDNAQATPFTDEELEFVRLLRSCSAEGRQIVFKLLETYRSPSVLKQTNAALNQTK